LIKTGFGIEIQASFFSPGVNKNIICYR